MIDMRIERFEDILSWQKARKLTMGVYASLKDCRDFSFRDQIQRACISVLNNISEGFERRGDKQFKYFLSIAKGSFGEVRSMLIISIDLGYINENDGKEFVKLSKEIAELIAALIKSLTT
jgi:four helix bundle protein